MADFSDNLFLALAKTADDHNLLTTDEFSLKGTEFENADFGDGVKDIEGFKNALFMIFMLRARRHMQSPEYSAQSKKYKRTHTCFGMTIIDDDFHGSGQSFVPSFENKTILGGIGERLDGYYLENESLSKIANALFTQGPDGEAPLARLACTQPRQN
ncbi:hypothetical protein [Litorimonas sp. WD9-15]|uniref:hypothetical protein n=1 Tax=Litorimonas sp. WD9-15 TaxID=3418716 RepID=UPI003D076159